VPRADAHVLIYVLHGAKAPLFHPALVDRG
jgi:hypothetical protein